MKFENHEMYFSCWSWSSLADDLASRYNAHTSSRSAYMLSQPKSKKPMRLIVKNVLKAHSFTNNGCWQIDTIITLHISSRPFSFATMLAGDNSWTACLRGQQVLVKACLRSRWFFLHLTYIYEFYQDLNDVRCPISPRSARLSSSMCSSSTCARIAKIWPNNRSP
jgi:hypothetical protein